MNPNGNSRDSNVPKIKIEPGLPSVPNSSSKKVNAKPASKKKSRAEVSSVASTSGNASPILGVKIKTEPGLVSSTLASEITNATQSTRKQSRPEIASLPSTSSNAAVLPAIKIKTEPGLSSTMANPPRLTSFRPARDLTLTGNLKPEKTNKRVFTPNLNVQRSKKKEDGTPANSDTGSRGRARGRGRGQNDRGRGRGRGTANVTQSSGVFSEGISEIARAARRAGGGSRSGVTSDREARAQLERPKLNLNVSVDKADEEEKLKLLLRDDFIDDGSSEIDTDNIPVSLPLIKHLELYKNESDEDIPMKHKAIDGKEIDDKPILENGMAISAKRKNVKNAPTPITLSVPDIIENESNGYMVLRFPDCLPGLQSYDDTHDQSNHHRNYNEKKPPDNNAENKNKTDYCTLRSLKAGHLGKLQIHRSGKARLLLGDNSLVVDMGSRLGFRQDVVAAKVDGLNKELVNLGRVTSTLVCTPDFESILAKL